jgi:hypothetical protein
MAQLSRRRAPDLRALAAALPALACGAPAFAQVDLAATWHVLVHYRDSHAAHPEAERWEDRFWEFEEAGGRLRWSEFPIVVFDDESGRFERRASGQYARVLHFWEPNPAQLANIHAGLAVNDRGAQTKSLRRSGDAWTSGPRASPTGASVLTYQETWSIADPEGLPVFAQVDVLGSEGAEGLEGRTEFRTERVLEGGRLLVGSFDRDGTRRGTFQMRRAGGRKALAKRTQAELQRKAAQRDLELFLARGGESSEELRLALEPLRGELERAGIEVDEAELGRLAERARALLADGKTPEEVRRQLVEALRQERGAPPSRSAPPSELGP